MSTQRHHRNGWLWCLSTRRRSHWRRGRGRWHWFGLGNHRATKKPRAQSNLPRTNLPGIATIPRSRLPGTFGSRRLTRQDTAQQLHEGLEKLSGRTLLGVLDLLGGAGPGVAHTRTERWSRPGSVARLAGQVVPGPAGNGTTATRLLPRGTEIRPKKGSVFFTPTFT